jgi:hypothetical protein
MENPKSEYRNWSSGLPTLRAGPQFRNNSSMLKIQMTETTYFSLNGHRFENLNIWILNLFRASCLGFRILPDTVRR